MEEKQQRNISQKRKPRFRFPLGAILLIIFGVTWLLANFGFAWVWKIWVPGVVIAVGVYLLLAKQRV